MSTFVVQFLGDWVSEKAHVLIKDSRHVFNSIAIYYEKPGPVHEL